MIIVKDQIIYSMVHGIEEGELLALFSSYFGEENAVKIVSTGGYLYGPKLSFFDDNYFKVLIIRHPVEWYRQFWISNMIKGWDANCNFQNTCKSDSFVEFADNVIKKDPMYYYYLCNQCFNDIKEIDYVVRIENYNTDVLVSLRLGLKRNAPIFGIPKLKNLKFHIQHEDYAKYDELAQYRMNQDREMIEANEKLIKQLF